MAYDEVELSDQRAASGGSISTCRAASRRPALAQREVREECRARAFRILTEDEERTLSKNTRTSASQVTELFKKK